VGSHGWMLRSSSSTITRKKGSTTSMCCSGTPRVSSGANSGRSWVGKK
jgi:hypothetical protein